MEENKIFSVYYPSEIADDNVIRATATLETVILDSGNEKIYTHNESVWKGFTCIGIIFGRGKTNVEGEDREAALEAVNGLADILVNEYGVYDWEDQEI